MTTRLSAIRRVGEIAQELIETYHIKSLGEFDLEPVVYENGIYVRNKLWRLKSVIQELEPESDNHFVAEVIGKVQRLTATSAQSFDSNPSLIALKNGILNVHTRQVIPFDPKYLMFSKLEVEYQPGRRSRAFERFMGDFLPNIDDRLRALDMFASTLLARPLKKACLLLGDTDSGKSTFLQIVEEFLGPENTSHIPIQELESDRFAAADLLHKRANIYADIDKTELKKSTRFKTSTGGDTLRVQRKFGQGFDLKPHAKHFFSANQAPQAGDESDAFWNRWVPLRCLTKFVSADEIESWRNPKTGEIPPHIRVKLPDIIAGLTTSEAKSGVLNILLKRLPKIIKLGTIPNAPTAEEVRQIWLLNANFQAQYLKASVRLVPEGRIGRRELYSNYATWCVIKRITPASPIVFNREAERFGGVRSEDGKDKFSPSGANWKGIAWTDSATSGGQNFPVAETTELATNRMAPARSATSARTTVSREKGLSDEILQAFSYFELLADQIVCPDCCKPMPSEQVLAAHRGLSHSTEKSV